MKVDCLFAGLNLNTIVQEKKRQTTAHFMDDTLTTGA